MKLTGFLLWMGASVLVAAVGNAIFRLSWFEKITNKVKDMKIYIVIALSVIFAVSYVFVNNELGIFGYFGANLYPIEDAIFSGMIISLGSDSVYQIWTAITKFKELIAAKTETEKSFAKKMEK